MCATGKRERRQRADRYGNPLDQLHGTSLRLEGRQAGPVHPNCRYSGSPSGGYRATIGGPPYGRQARIVAYSA